ncbi:MAG: electron transport complex subunit RsxA, partial [bacterium]|nr:electron transport complex subunit RsxA [bacterium]
WVLNNFVLAQTPYLRLICFIVVIASSVQFVEMFIKKLFPPLFRALGIFLPLITTNCAILFLALTQTSKGYSLFQGLIYAWGAGIGLTLALVLMAGMREENELASIPNVVKGLSMSFFLAGILSMAFMGFAGLFYEG